MGIALIGYRGCGKTTIGRKLADRLWQQFVDTDDLIVQKAGLSIAEIFATHGEKHFRDLEVAAVRQASLLQDHVIALGGGALGREENRRAIKDAGHKLVYLRCEPQILAQRIKGDPQSQDNRPNLTDLGGGIQEIQKVLAQREPIWRAALDAELDVTHLSPEDAVVYIVRLV